MMVDDELIDTLIIDCYSRHREVILQTLLSFKVNFKYFKVQAMLYKVVLLLLIFEQNHIIFGVRNFEF